MKLININLPPLKIFFSANHKLYTSIYNIFGFYPKNIYLYKLALHHKSAPIDDSAKIDLNNERLEYLGDAIIGAIVAEYLYKLYPYKKEGFLSEMRSKLVSRSQLNSLCKTIGLNKLIAFQHQGNAKSIEGDAFEAFFGALFLDKGFNFTKRILVQNIINRNFDLQEIEQKNSNFKSIILEWSQKNKKFAEFKVVDEIQGNGHGKQYIVRVFIDGTPMETGCDYNIKGAEQAAASKTIEKLNIQI
ncbi:MAG: ribonuclease III [Bacteroidales bacterium]|nr:ribonuclease III [Bacteroidales bacterium]MDD2203912.1 ribonuclease III [Bacteroidales bacterium]MDD3151473.1 ribonuclease III [Bacteroidales bacterium]MDD3913073.1 ribonuclease III [Bacteroidales bacterium]MDD4632988.1 ribonuclease III [Bacteroidales bacterium]